MSKTSVVHRDCVPSDPPTQISFPEKVNSEVCVPSLYLDQVYLPFRIASPQPLLGEFNGGPIVQVFVHGSYTSVEFTGFQLSQPPTA